MQIYFFKIVSRDTEGAVAGNKLDWKHKDCFCLKLPYIYSPFLAGTAGESRKDLDLAWLYNCCIIYFC